MSPLCCCVRRGKHLSLQAAQKSGQTIDIGVAYLDENLGGPPLRSLQRWETKKLGPELFARELSLPIRQFSPTRQLPTHSAVPALPSHRHTNGSCSTPIAPGWRLNLAPPDCDECSAASQFVCPCSTH